MSKINVSILSRALALTFSASLESHGRPVLAGVHLSLSEKGFVATATDGSVLTMLEFPIPFDISQNAPFSVILPTSEAKRALAHIKGLHKPSVVPDGGGLKIDTTTFGTVFGKYPEAARVIPGRPECPTKLTDSVTVDRAEVLKQVIERRQEAGEKDGIRKIYLTPDNGKLVVSASPVGKDSILINSAKIIDPLRAARHADTKDAHGIPIAASLVVEYSTPMEPMKFTCGEMTIVLMPMRRGDGE